MIDRIEAKLILGLPVTEKEKALYLLFAKNPKKELIGGTK